MTRARVLVSAVSAAFVLVLVGAGQPGRALGPPAARAPATQAHLSVVQAVPGAAVEVTVDGRTVAADARAGDVLGPFTLDPGGHEVAFVGGDVEVRSRLEMGAGASTDVVLHLPAEVGGDPVVHSYDAPMGAIAPGKARVVLAHTATVAPADVSVDGQTVFTNIANGEFAEAEVPAGSHRVALYPSGRTTDAILGPLDVPLEGRTLSMIYAFGSPRDGSMDVISHTAALAADGTVRPTTIDTGSAGLAGDREVVAFTLPR